MSSEILLPHPPPPGGIGARHRQLALSFFGMMVYAIQADSLSIGIVAMTEMSGNNSTPVLNYTIQDKGLITGLFGYGYTLGNVMAGYLADRFGPMTTAPLAGGIIGGFLSLILPSVAIYGNFEAACTIRFFQGVFLSSIFPSSYVHLAKWVVGQEQAKFGWIWSGNQLGSCIMLLLGGPLADSAGGWPYIFYFSGIIGIIWGTYCLCWGVNSPVELSTMSVEEREYFKANLLISGSVKHLKTPWFQMLTSIPLWAFVIVQTCDWWTFESTFTLEPTYLNGVFDLSVDKTGFFSALNYAFNIPTSFLFAYLESKLSQHVSSNFSRKLWTCVGLFGSALAFLFLALCDFGSTGAIIVFIVACSINSASQPGYMANVLDVAPNFAGTIAGIYSTVSCLGSSAGPVVVGYMLEDEGDVSAWKNVFLMNSVIYAFGTTVFLLFGSTQEQPWNNPETPDVDEPTNRPPIDIT